MFQKFIKVYYKFSNRFLPIYLNKFIIKVIGNYFIRRLISMNNNKHTEMSRFYKCGKKYEMNNFDIHLNAYDNLYYYKPNKIYLVVRHCIRINIIINVINRMRNDDKYLAYLRTINKSIASQCYEKYINPGKKFITGFNITRSKIRIFYLSETDELGVYTIKTEDI